MTSTGVNNAVEMNNPLPGEATKYQILSELGSGGFGRVFECENLTTKKKMAMKIIPKTKAIDGEREVTMLREIRKLDLRKNNLIEFTDSFTYNEDICIVFEKLDLSLFHLMEARGFKPLDFSEIRAITEQMLVALAALKSINVVHTDIKPDNILLVNHQLEPFRVKLIDFGLATPVTKLKRGTVVQVRAYRAPEVILGFQMSEAIDIWALACVMAALYLGRELYPSESSSSIMKAIVQLNGLPPKDLMDHGVYTKEYFKRNRHDSSTPWKLRHKTSRTYRDPIYFFHSLYEIPKLRRQATSHGEFWETHSFISLLKGMLHVDHRSRLTPTQALKSKFITDYPALFRPDCSSLQDESLESNVPDSSALTDKPAATGFTHVAEDTTQRNCFSGILDRILCRRLDTE